MPVVLVYNSLSTGGLEAAGVLEQNWFAGHDYCLRCDWRVFRHLLSLLNQEVVD
ncbi:MAG: hypothetical protein JSV68_19075 [Anaerolineaceae bacterium]|nr:MAG: hypothetical protein JSV68_19075 [Anaerolineaceae bacterium]